MIRTVSFSEAAVLDSRLSGDFSIDTLMSIETAASGMTDILKSRFPDHARSRILVVAGRGNNACDALAIARRLSCDPKPPIIKILTLEQRNESLASRYLKALSALGIPIEILTGTSGIVLKEFLDADIVLDGVAGTGQTGELSGPAARLVDIAYATSAIKVAIDVPSGCLSPDSPAYADYTLCVIPLKRELFSPLIRPRCGEIIPVPGVFPDMLLSDASGKLMETADLPFLLPRIPASFHKGDKGRVTCFSGSPGMSGAAVLSAKSALASRAGLVSVYTEESCRAIIASGVPEIMVRSMVDFSGKFHPTGACLFGPGWGVTQEHGRLLSRALSSATPLVIDADAITLLAEMGPEACSGGGPILLTPHPREFARLAGSDDVLSMSDPLPTIVDIARRYRAVVILKACASWIVAPDGTYAVVDGMNPALATAGSGDILAGCVVGLLASGMDPFATAQAAVIAHQEAGRTLRIERGNFPAGALVGALERLVAV